MAQKKYQTLQTKNMEAAKRIYEYLKTHKVIDEKTFAALYFNSSIDYAHQIGAGIFDGSYNNRVKTTRQFLYDHGLMTSQILNGLRTHAATSKCWRTLSFKNATKEVQEIANDDIDKAIEYVRINNGAVPVEYEAPIVANMLKLEGEHWKIYVTAYQSISDSLPEYLGIKYRVLSPLDYLTRNGMAVKV